MELRFGPRSNMRAVLGAEPEYIFYLSTQTFIFYNINQATMPAVNTQPYPRSVVKRIVKAHTKCNTSKNIDVLVCHLHKNKPMIALSLLNDRPALSRLCVIPPKVRVFSTTTLSGSHC